MPATGASSAEIRIRGVDARGAKWGISHEGPPPVQVPSRDQRRLEGARARRLIVGRRSKQSRREDHREEAPEQGGRKPRHQGPAIWEGAEANGQHRNGLSKGFRRGRKGESATLVGGDLEACQPGGPREEDGKAQDLRRIAQEGGQVVNISGTGGPSDGGGTGDNRVISNAPEEGRGGAAHPDRAEHAAQGAAIRPATKSDRAVPNQGHKRGLEPGGDTPILESGSQPLQG